jgi:hypothetical protein
MTRAVHATTPSGDEVTLEASAQVAVRPRTVAQVERNAMQALDLVRAALAALTEVTRALERAALLLSHNRGPLASSIIPELRRISEQLGVNIENAELHGTPLLRGATAAFALQAASDELSEPIRVELPNLSDAYRALIADELTSHTSPAALAQRHAQLLSEAQAGRAKLTATAKYLSEVLSNQRPKTPKATLPRRADDERFVSLIQQVRDSVLHAGGAALRVQGSPTTRAAWLVEAVEQSR